MSLYALLRYFPKVVFARALLLLHTSLCICMLPHIVRATVTIMTVPRSLTVSLPIPHAFLFFRSSRYVTLLHCTDSTTTRDDESERTWTIECVRMYLCPHTYAL